MSKHEVKQKELLLARLPFVLLSTVLGPQVLQIALLALQWSQSHILLMIKCWIIQFSVALLVLVENVAALTRCKVHPFDWLVLATTSDISIPFFKEL